MTMRHVNAHMRQIKLPKTINIIVPNEATIKENELRNLYGIWNEYEETHKGSKGSNEIFANWFMQRFPGERDNSYIYEWVARFHSGTPTIHMDSKSLKLYIKEVKRWNGMK
jgi:hypothetical protein